MPRAIQQTGRAWAIHSKADEACRTSAGQCILHCLIIARIVDPVDDGVRDWSVKPPHSGLTEEPTKRRPSTKRFRVLAEGC